MSGSSTYDLSTLYSALGVRAKDAMARIPTGSLTPVIVLGNIETFAPAVIEARGLYGDRSATLINGNWTAVSLFSTAAGGAIIEQLDHPAVGDTPSVGEVITYNIAPNKPFTGAGGLDVLTMGGRPVFSILDAFGGANPGPNGQTLGGTRTRTTTPQIASGLWIPPGSYFWLLHENASGGGVDHWRMMRWRELLEPQGAA